jgi:glycerol dehydrogenase
MTDSLQTHAIAPALVFRGAGAWREALPRIVALGQRPLLLGRSVTTAGLRQQLLVDLEQSGARPVACGSFRDCCDEDLGSLALEAQAAGCDALVAAGGGKVLDAGKLLAQRLGLPCITVPTSAATCAGWTALANLYTPEGAFLGDVALERCPDLLVFDHDLVRQAPARTLASGIADAMAKWYEASVSSGTSGDGLVQQAVQMARLLRDLLLLEAEAALVDPSSPAWVRVAEGCALTAGLIGGLGGARCRTVAAHAVHNGLTQLAATHGCLHGEKVGFGVLVQLWLEEQLAGNRLAAQARRQLLPFFRQLGLPTDLEALGLGGSTLDDLRLVCRFACQETSDLRHLPFPVAPEDLLAAMVGATADRQQA